MTKTIKVALAGAGAFSIKHLDGIKNIDGVEIVSLVSRELDAARQVATKYGGASAVLATRSLRFSSPQDIDAL